MGLFSPSKKSIFVHCNEGYEDLEFLIPEGADPNAALADVLEDLNLGKRFVLLANQVVNVDTISRVTIEEN